MKENKYDNINFYNKYCEMDRSKYGLTGAGEWYQLKPLLPIFTNKKVLDLGCGFGWHCKYAVDNGAKFVTGVDISEKMLARAKKENGAKNIEYLKLPMEDISFPNESYDVVISSLAFHYVENFEELAKKIYLTLKQGGDFIFSVEHPIFTAEGKQDWVYDSSGKPLYWPVDNYYFEGERKAIFLGEKITKYHRSISTYVETLLKLGFKLKHLVEVKPSKEMVEKIVGMKDELRRPMMLIISVSK